MAFGALRRSEHSVRVGDQHFVVRRPYWGHAEVHVDGTPLTRDPYGNLVCPDGKGGRRKVSATFDVRQLSPALDVDGTRHLTLPVLPWHLRLALLVLVVVSVASGAIGVLPVLIVTWGVAAACRRWSTGPAVTAVVTAAVATTAGWLTYLALA